MSTRVRGKRLPTRVHWSSAVIHTEWHHTLLSSLTTLGFRTERITDSTTNLRERQKAIALKYCKQRIPEILTSKGAPNLGHTTIGIIIPWWKYSLHNIYLSKPVQDMVFLLRRVWTPSNMKPFLSGTHACTSQDPGWTLHLGQMCYLHDNISHYQDSLILDLRHLAQLCSRRTGRYPAEVRAEDIEWPKHIRYKITNSKHAHSCTLKY